MENRDFTGVYGSADAPYINRLAARSGVALQSYAVSHPSLPNYLALLAGSTFGITSDCTDCSVVAPNLASQLTAAHIGWRAYMEDMPTPCFAGASYGGYAKKHDPFMYFRNIATDPAACANVVPFARLNKDIASPAGLPAFTWITPNLCHSGHDCSNASSDAWLAGLVPAVLKTMRPGGILILTWDEGVGTQGCCGGGAGGHVLTIVAGPGAKPKTTLNRPVDHYSVLKTIELIYGLKLLAGAACPCTNGLTSLFRNP
jgi:phosphatidylinositol-3-phosphatase